METDNHPSLRCWADVVFLYHHYSRIIIFCYVVTALSRIVETDDYPSLRFHIFYKKLKYLAGDVVIAQVMAVAG